MFLAPMAGVTDPVFRSICKELGADVLVTEFVSAEGVLKAWERNRRYTQIQEEHRPIGIQLFGSNGKRMGEAAKIVMDHDKPDFIDINCGCPVNKVVGKNGGSSLLKDLGLLASVVRGVVQAVGDVVPVTVKMRTGWDDGSVCALEACRLVEAEGASMICIHGRTRAQQYSGEANWELIEECAEAVRIPLIGNGDVSTARHIFEIRQKGKVSGVMVGRAAMQNPWIFSDAKYYFANGCEPPPRTLHEKWGMVLKHAEKSLESQRYGDEKTTMKFMRGRLLAYSKNEPGAKLLRTRITKIETYRELELLVSSFLEDKGI